MQGRPHIVPICAAIVGFQLLRALIPIGYMPASAGTGLLFELCPDQLPVGVTFANSEHDHHHHHDESESASGDACDIGHMLASAWADSADYETPIEEPFVDFLQTRIYRSVMLVVRRIYASRAPPTP